MIGHGGEKVTIGVDVGSGSVKVLATDSKHRKVSFGEVSYEIDRPGPNLAAVGADVWYEAAVRAIRTCLRKGNLDADRVGGVAVCGPAHNAVLLDALGRPVRPVIHWSDTRAALQACTLKREMGERVLELTLHPPMAGWTLSQFIWVQENDPESWSRATTWAVTKDYVAFKLTGELGTDPYDAAGTQMYDVKAGFWSPDLLDRLGWSPIRNSPRVRGSTELLGRITARASALTGLRQGTPVAVGTGDTMCEALASGAWSSGDTLIKLGTSGNVVAVAERPTTEDGILNYPYLDRDEWITVMATTSGAASARWFREVFLSTRRPRESGQSADGYRSGALPSGDWTGPKMVENHLVGVEGPVDSCNAVGDYWTRWREL